MSDDLKPSPFAYDVPGPLFTVAQAARRMAEPGIPSDLLTSQLRRWNAQGVIFASGKKGNGPTAANLFALHDVLIAKVISELTDLGIEDVAALRRAAIACYASVSENPKYVHSIIEAVVAVRDGKLATFQLDILRHSQTGERYVHATICPDAVSNRGRLSPTLEKMLSEGWAARAAVSIELNSLVQLVLTPREKAN